MKSLVIGDVSVDTIVQLAAPLTSAATHFPVDTYERIGGSAAGKALNLDYFQHEVDLIARIGLDSVGKTIKNRFKETGVKPHFIETNEASITHTNYLAQAAERISIFTSHPDVNLDAYYAQYQSLIASTDALFLELSGGFHSWAFQIKHPNVWVDLHDYDGINPFMDPYIQAARIVVMSDTQLPEAAAHAVGMKLSRQKEAVIITHSSQGLTLYQDGNRHEYPAFDAKIPVDSDGAGDALISALFHHWDEGTDVAISKAMAHAAHVVMVKDLTLNKTPHTRG